MGIIIYYPCIILFVDLLTFPIEEKLLHLPRNVHSCEGIKKKKGIQVFIEIQD